jgi:flagellar biosynthetic protein FliR
VAAPADLMSMPGYLAIIGEVAIGSMLGFVLQFAFAAPHRRRADRRRHGPVAGRVHRSAVGRALASLGQYFAVVMTLIFLAMGCHLQWLALVVRSYEAFPPGQVLGSAVLAPRIWAWCWALPRPCWPAR